MSTKARKVNGNEIAKEMKAASSPLEASSSKMFNDFDKDLRHFKDRSLRFSFPLPSLCAKL